MPTRKNLAIDILAPLAHRQHGLFTSVQANDVGMSKVILDHRVQNGEIVAVDHLVFRAATTPPTWHQRVMAACLAGPAVASHRTAAALWRLPDVEQVDVEVTAWRHRRRTPSDVTWHESYLLDNEQVTEVDGIPVTNPTRTVLDLAGVVDDDFALRALDDLVRRRLTDTTRVGVLLERLGPRRVGTARARRILDVRNLGSHGVSESDLETRFDILLRSNGLPMPTRQIRVAAPDGRTFRVDSGYEDYRLGFEMLGAQFHATPDRWAADIDRLMILAELDWHILQFGYEQVTRRQAGVVNAVWQALLRAGYTP